MRFDAAHIHLMLNHAPVMGSLFAVAVLALALAFRKDESTRLALIATVLVALMATVVYLTGEPAEEAVEALAQISEARVESHEEIALVATIAAGISGLAALGALLFFRRRPIPIGASLAILLLATTSAGAMGYTAWRGGAIRHSEIRGDAVSIVNPDQPAQPDHPDPRAEKPR